MAEEKKSVILYVDIISTFEAMTDQQAGRLIKHYLRYVNDLNPKPPDKITQIAFEPIKQQLKRDLVKWETIKNKRSEAGKVSAELRKQKSTNSTHVESVQQTSTNPTVNGNVNVNGNVINRERDTPLPEFRIEECLTVAMNDQRWVRANKATVIDLKEFNQLLERRGKYNKNPGDYKSHFANWKASGKKDMNFNEPIEQDFSLKKY